MPGPPGFPDLPELMIVGPGELHEEELELLGAQVIAHYGEFWTALHGRTVDALGRLLGVSNPPYLIPGSGSACLDAAALNLFEPGQTVVVPSTGFFGNRLVEVARAQRLEVIEVPVQVGAPADPARIAEAARGADAIFSVHVETATGVRHPIQEIAAVARDAGALFLVDAIASAGGELVDVDAMGLDAVVTSTQKGLEAPPGLGVLAVGTRGRQRIEARPESPRTWYLDLKRWDWYRSEWGSWHPHPVTMPTNTVVALASSLRRILDVGIEPWVAQRAELARRCREGLEALGLKPIPQPGSEANLVVAAWTDQGAEIQRYLMSEEKIMVSGGLAPAMGKAIRVGLMGRTATEAMVDRLLAGVENALRALPAAPEAPV